MSDVKKQLLQRYVAADSPERFRIKKDIEDIEASLRQLNIGAKALNYIASDESKSEGSTAASGSSSSQNEISQHWMDKFSELARTHNEPWREDLLSRALAAESVEPGTVSTRALWLLGAMEEHHFIAFATILDLCSIVEGLVVPSHSNFNTRPIPECELGPQVSLGHLIYRLEDVGLLADTLSTSRVLRKGSCLVASYDTSFVQIECATQDLKIHGVILTGVGASVASFCERRFNPLGKEIFEA